MPKLKRCMSNYVKLPFVVVINPVVYCINIVFENISRFFCFIFNNLPRLDLDYSEDIEKARIKPRLRYFGNTNKENNNA